MGHRVVTIALGFLVAAAATAARADSGPVIVIPGKRGVPVVVNYHDARWAVVEGDWGLNRPGHGQITVLGGRFVGPMPERRSGFYPKNGEPPTQGRREVEPTADRPTPAPAENFSRSWSSAPPSDPVPPADLPNPNATPMGAEGVPLTPPVIVVPQVGPRRHR